MDLVEVDVVDVEPAERVGDAVEYVLARLAAAVGKIAHLAVYLRGDHHLVAAGELLEQLAADLFGYAAAVDVGGVEEGDAEFDGAAHDRPSGVLVENPGLPLGRAEAHHAQTEARYLEAAVAESRVIHGPGYTVTERSTEPKRKLAFDYLAISVSW